MTSVWMLKANFRACGKESHELNEIWTPFLIFRLLKNTLDPKFVENFVLVRIRYGFLRRRSCSMRRLSPGVPLPVPKGASQAGIHHWRLPLPLLPSLPGHPRGIREQGWQTGEARPQPPPGSHVQETALKDATQSALQVWEHLQHIFFL